MSNALFCLSLILYYFFILLKVFLSFVSPLKWSPPFDISMKFISILLKVSSLVEILFSQNWSDFGQNEYFLHRQAVSSLLSTASGNFLPEQLAVANERECWIVIWDVLSSCLLIHEHCFSLPENCKHIKMFSLAHLLAEKTLWKPCELPLIYGALLTIQATLIICYSLFRFIIVLME